MTLCQTCFGRVACALYVLLGDFELVLDAWVGLEYMVVDESGSSFVRRNYLSGTSQSVAVGRSGNSCMPVPDCSCLICRSEPTALGCPSRTFRSASVLAGRVFSYINSRLEPEH